MKRRRILQNFHPILLEVTMLRLIDKLSGNAESEKYMWRTKYTCKGWEK